jgi:hypothetical protein
MLRILIVLATLAVPIEASSQTLLEAARHYGAASNSISVDYPYLKIGQLARVADIVVIGQIDAARASLTPDQNHVVTDYMISVIRMLKGTNSARESRLTMRYPAGTLIVDGLTLTTVNDEFPVNSMNPGETFVLFLNCPAGDVPCRAANGAESFLKLTGDIVETISKGQGRDAENHAKALSDVVTEIQAAIERD